MRFLKDPYNAHFGKTSQSKKQRFETFTIEQSVSTMEIEKVNHFRNRLCALEAFKCLNGIAQKAFEHYFTRNNHKINTCKNTKSSVIPNITTKTGRKAYLFKGAKIFNNLPDDLQSEASFFRFKASSKGTNLESRNLLIRAR